MGRIPMTESLDQVGAWIAEQLPELLRKHRVPAASIAVLSGDEIFTTASGVLNKLTGVEATPDSVFQIGSITKVWTASLVMQLVDEGLVELDAPLQRYMPEFALADEQAATRITVRQLLSHTSGFEGDVFTATTQGEDAVERFVEVLSDIPQLFAPGEMFSYNNAAFAVLGRLVEVVRGTRYDVSLREHLITPLQLDRAATSAAEAIRFRAALGHLTREAGGEPQPASEWSLIRAHAPAGSIFGMSAENLLGFAKLHLNGGVGPDGTQVLSAASVAAMQEEQVKLPVLGTGRDGWGLGWRIFDWAGGRAIGHNGGTLGQAAFFRVFPDHGVAVALLTNGGSGQGLYTDLVLPAVDRLTGIAPHPAPTPPADASRIDASRYVGTYRSQAADIHVSQDDDGRIWITHELQGIFAEIGPKPEPAELVHWRGDTVLSLTVDGVTTPQYEFVGDDGAGKATHLHNGRASRRISQ